MREIKKIGISDLYVSSKSITLKTSGLGSCVGIILFDKLNKIGGISHIMLPDKPENIESYNILKYCDSNIPYFYQMMLDNGARKHNLLAGLFGGSEMFYFRNNPLLNIGKRNIEKSIHLLNELNIPIMFQDTGGSNGRTIQLHLDTGIIDLYTSYEDEKHYQF